MAQVVSVDPDVLRVGPHGPRLIGSRCEACGTYTFPAQDGCPRCAGPNTARVDLEPRGTLWTWTVQGFPPKAPPYIGVSEPTQYQPFGVGYVELPGQVMVEARLTESDPGRLHIGMELQLTLAPLTIDESGATVVTYAF